MSITYAIEDDQLTELEATIKQYQEGAEDTINRYLHGTGYSRFEAAIRNAMPESGRKWRGKKTAAKKANSLQDKNKNENLAVTIKARQAYGYLYFPDDGYNTINHFGNQRFFEKGVESETETAVNDMIELLTFND